MRWTDWHIDDHEKLELWKQILICAIKSNPINISFPELEGIGKDFLEGPCFKAVLCIKDTVSETFMTDSDKLNNIRRILYELRCNSNFNEWAMRRIGEHKDKKKTSKTQKSKEDAYKQYMETFHHNYTLNPAYQVERSAFYAGWLIANGYQFEMLEGSHVYEKDGKLDVFEDPYRKYFIDLYDDDDNDEDDDDLQEQERHYHKLNDSRTPPDIDWEE